MKKVLLQLLATIILLVVANQLPLESLEPWCLAAILIFGSPHGSLDFRLFKLSKQYPLSLTKFVSKYLLFGAGFLLIWFIHPFNALVIFVVLSIYHFGQERAEEIGIKNSLWFTLNWGSFVLLVPFLTNWQELSFYVESMTFVRLPEISPTTRWLIAATLFTVTFLTSLIFQSLRLLSGRKLTEHLLLFLVLSAIFFTQPLLVSFTIYFVIFHSMNAMTHAYRWLKSSEKMYSIRNLLRDILPFTFTAYFGAVVFMLFFRSLLVDWHAVLLLVFISMLTLPHMLIFNDLYEGQEK